ncbi:MAG: hypothetical protein NC400_08280 [Clostridium sp.]|nr:hypothetical protein [Clostridium sp.]
MKKIVYKSKAIQTVILIAALCLLASLWPFRIWHETVSMQISPYTGSMTEVINEEKTVMQSIVAQYDHMDTINVYLAENNTGDYFYLRILDEQWQMICEEKAKIDHDALPGYQEVLIDVDMEVGGLYYIILQGYKDAELYAGYEAFSPQDMPYLLNLYYDNSGMDGMSLVADYNYSVPLRKTKVLIFGALIAAAAALSILAVRLWYRKKEDKLITVEKAFRWVMNPIVAAAAAFCLGAVLMGVCGKYTLDNTVYIVSILLLAMILFYGINHNRTGQAPVITFDYLKDHKGDLLQSVAIAGAIGGCCEYMAGLYDIHHAVAERKEMLWFCIAVLAMFKWKEVAKLYNLIYLLAAGFGGWRYYQTHLTEDMDELGVQVLKLTVWIGVLFGLIVVNTVIGLFRKKLAKPSLFAGLLAVFFVLIIVFRNERWWGAVMAAAFTLFYLNYGMWEHKERILVNIARGVVFQFAWATGYSLLYRPYVTFRNARYTHIFHTVTITATYLTMVECAAAVILLCKLAKSRKLRDCWKEMTLFGVASSYMIFTMARTAFFAIGVTLLFVLVITASGKGLERLKSFGKNLGILFIAVAVCLPITFSAQRNIPALVSKPFLYEIEYAMYCPEDVMRGRRLDSLNYMRVGRFIDVFAEKIFGIPEGTFDVYGEIAALEEYRRIHGADSAKAEESFIEDFIEDKGVFGGSASTDKLVASADYVPEDIPEEIPEDNDYTNGRLDIFRSYIEQLNMTGHVEMGAVLKDGEIATHAHNIYLQVAYDHGIPVGIVFALVGIAAFVSSCLYYRREKDKITYAALPAVIIVAVAVAGLVEWIFHLSNPCGLLLMLVITPLMFKNEG